MRSAAAAQSAVRVRRMLQVSMADGVSIRHRRCQTAQLLCHMRRSEWKISSSNSQHVRFLSVDNTLEGKNDDEKKSQPQNDRLSPSPSPSSPLRSSSSPEQDRAAQLEYEHMERATGRLLAMDSLTPASLQEFRVAFQYWAGRRPLQIAVTAGNDHNMEQQATLKAEALWQWVLEKDDPELLQAVIKTNESSVGGLISFIERYLMPFRGTFQSMVVSRRRLRFQPQMENHQNALGKASEILQLMNRLLEDSSNKAVVPDYLTCNMELTVWSKRCWFLSTFGDQRLDDDVVQNALGGARSPRDCLDRMEQFVDTMRHDTNYPEPDKEAIILLLTAWVQSGLPNRAEQAERLLKSIRHQCDEPVAFNATMYAHASLAEKDPTHATSAALLMGELKDSGIPMNVATYATMLLAFANAGEVRKAEDLLLQMESNVEVVGFAPNSVCYNTVMDALAKTADDPQSPERAEALLKRMDQLNTSRVIPEGPDIVSYSSVIDAWCRSSDPLGAERAEKLLLECELRSEENPSLRPDIIPYNIVLDAYSRRGTEKAMPFRRDNVNTTSVERAEQLLRHMQNGHNPSALPETISYNCLLNAWATSGAYDKAAERAREVLKQMKEDYEAGNSFSRPDRITYNVVLRLVARCPSKEYPNEVEDLLQEISDRGLQADVITYNSVMDSIIKSGATDCERKVGDILQWMEEQHRNGNDNVRPNELTYNTVLHAHAKMGHPDAAERVLQRMMEVTNRSNDSYASPSIVSFTTVIDAYAQRGQADAAEALVQKIDQTRGVSPNRFSFNSVLNSLAKSRQRDAPQRAEKILNRMQEEYEEGDDDVQPDTVSFSTVINCWAQSGQPGAADRAEAILQRMEELNDRGQSLLRPNAVTYSAVVNALSKSGEPDAADRAVRLLDRMEDAFRNGRQHAKPNAYCYNAVINAIAKSQDPNKPARAREIFKRMKTAYEKGGDANAKPNVTTYSSILNACAYTSGTKEDKANAYKIARTTLKDMIDSNVEPTMITYLNFMTACAKLLPPGGVREKMLVATFRECHRSDMVIPRIVDILRFSVRPHVFDKCMAFQQNGQS